MKISLNWINEFTPVDRRKVKELAERVSVSLTEVESFGNFRGVDTVLEIENKALTHRPDCFSHLGIAREIASIQKTPYKNPIPKLNKKKINHPKKILPLKIKVKEPELCKRYTVAILKDLVVKPSPLWMQERLLACGVKPINNIVDITNVVMLELGQPLHAFDYDKIKPQDNDNKEIIIRLAKRNERLTTLDGIQRELKKDMLVISDPERAIAIAGVMGGANTEVSAETKTIVIESANFEMHNIRRTGKLTGLHTEAILRYEKGQDPSLTYPALVRTIMLLEKYAKGKIISPIIDHYSEKPKHKTIVINPEIIRNQIGTEITTPEIKRILKRLELEVETEEIHPPYNEPSLKVNVPLFRSDINIPEDFLEEIARIYGYDKIEPSLPIKDIKPVSDTPEQLFKKKIITTLAYIGLNEIYSYSFISENAYRKTHLDHSDLMSIQNPISPELKYLRNSLIPSLLEKAEINSKTYNEFKFFEVGNEIHPTSPKKLPEEKAKICGLVYKKGKEDTFYIAKGILETLFNKIGYCNLQFTPPETTFPYFEKDRAAEIKILIDDNTEIAETKSSRRKEIQKEITIAYIGDVSKTVKNNFSLNGEVTVFEIDLEALTTYIPQNLRYKRLPKYPSVFEDISFVISHNLPVETLRQKIVCLNDQIASVDLKEKPFTSPKIGIDKKSITFTIEYYNNRKTLNSLEIKPIRYRIIQALKKEYQAQLRQ